MISADSILGSSFDTILAVVVVVAASVLSAMVITFLTTRTRRKEKQEDWARQDQVACRLEKANKELAAAASVQTEKLEVIHGMVNGQYTGALRAELAASRDALLMMEELIRLREVYTGQPPTEESLHILDQRRTKIADLRVAYDERVRLTKIAEQGIHVRQQDPTA